MWLKYIFWYTLPCLVGAIYRTYTRLHTHTHTPTHTRLHTHTHAHTHIHTHIHTYTHTPTHTHPCAYTHTHTHTHTYPKSKQYKGRRFVELRPTSQGSGGKLPTPKVSLTSSVWSIGVATSFTGWGYRNNINIANNIVDNPKCRETWENQWNFSAKL